LASCGKGKGVGVLGDAVGGVHGVIVGNGDVGCGMGVVSGDCATDAGVASGDVLVNGLSDGLQATINISKPSKVPMILNEHFMLNLHLWLMDVSCYRQKRQIQIEKSM
jgi:hypothetical protein